MSLKVFVASVFINCQNLFRIVTHSQLLKGLKCESQIENNGRQRSQGTLPGSQHYRGVEGCAGASGWD
jgi:hypothetical protein